jgi:glucosamine--fructose-6-phosphate aminotransferase (isomerizing)
MCGIVGYTGKQSAAQVLIAGLQRLEYRGYDSAGIAVAGAAEPTIVKSVGKVSNLAAQIVGIAGIADAHTGIAHTRWATHGAPTKQNAHPHSDDNIQFVCAHNGIIENYRALREQLEYKGHVFSSETDSEVIPHLIAEFHQGDFVNAVAAALRQMQGTFGITVISKYYPGQIVTARRGSPIVIGVGDRENIVASDVSAIIEHTSKVIYLNDGDIASVTSTDVSIRNLDNLPVNREIQAIEWDIDSVEKGGFDHFMLKEIFEQPEAIRNAIRGRLDHESGNAILSGLSMSPQDLVKIKRVIIAACGTSMHAGMVGEYFFEDLADLLTEVEQAAEFRYRNPIINEESLIIAISQSGETADTLAALREAKMKGGQVTGLCNVVGSTIAREAERGVYLHAGPEIGVASTKAFTCQVSVLLMMALKFGRTRRLTRQDGVVLAQEIETISDLVQQVIDHAEEIEAIATKWNQCKDFFFIGRGYLYPVALEGALKLKEVSYIHAEGYHAAELKHGPIALLDPKVPVVALANDIMGKEKVLGNIQECVARKAPVIITATEGDDSVKGLTNDIIWIPRSSQWIVPITTVVALQLFSYYVARERGCAIDQPRNLAKSVTVE